MTIIESYYDERKQSEYDAETVTPELTEWIRLQLYQGRQIIKKEERVMLIGTCPGCERVWYGWALERAGWQFCDCGEKLQIKRSKGKDLYKKTKYILTDEYGRVIDESEDLDRIKRAKKANPGSKLRKKKVKKEVEE